MLGVTGLAGAYYVGARMRPQLIGCALTVTILKGGWMSEDTTVHLPLLPPPTVPDTSLHTNGRTTANY